MNDRDTNTCKTLGLIWAAFLCSLSSLKGRHYHSARFTDGELSGSVNGPKSLELQGAELGIELMPLVLAL